MISNFNEEAEEILIKAKLEMLELKHPYVGTEHLVLAMLHTKNELSENLIKYNLTYIRFKKEILNIIGKGTKKSDFFLHTPLLKKVIENAIIDSKENNNGIVTINHLFSSILDIGEGIAIRIFIGMNLDLDQMYDEFTNKIYDNHQNKKLLIEEIGTNINELVKNKQIDPIIERDKEIIKLEEIICRRNKNNPLLIGEPGVGKTAIVEGLATLIEEKKVPEQLKNKIIISLDMASAVAGTKYRGEFEERMKKILKEIEDNQNIILFIDEIHTLIGAGGAEGAIDASNILKPALARGKIRCIGATTISEYKKNFEKDKALERRFQTITIEEPTIEQTKNILYHIKPIYENYHNVTISNNIIDNLIELTEKYIYNRFRPDKQIDVLDEVCSKVSINENKEFITLNKSLKELRDKKELYIKENNIKRAYECKIKETDYKNKINKKKRKKEVTINDIAEIIGSKTAAPLYEILKDNKEAILKIKKKLNNEIIGQKEAIQKIINATKRIKLNNSDNRCHSFLFIGPSGSGKTKTANLYGKLLTNNNIIRIDMAEYSDASGISKFIGSSAGYVGYDDNKYTLNLIKDKPNAIIILEDIDKAHPRIVNLISKILEESKIKDAKNNIINLSNNIIIMTTTINNKSIGFNQKQNNYIDSTFDLSLLGRIDNIIEFGKLTEQDIRSIIEVKLQELSYKYKDIEINYDNNIADDIVKESNYQKFGARKIDKIIKNKIESIIIDSIINNLKEVNIISLFAK